MDSKNAKTGLVNGTRTFNSYEYAASPVNDYFRYGMNAYDLSHYFTPTKEGNNTLSQSSDGYVYKYYANGDYQYARVGHNTFDGQNLRTGEPNYGSAETHHIVAHNHDAKRWNNTQKVNIPLYSTTQNSTYNGAHDPYENDFLFFGQHLDKVKADAYPQHINSVAIPDEALSNKGGNRVYKTAGYYGSKDNNGFYYNKDAWALPPTLTAIDFTSMTSESDGAVTLPSAFNVDSNKDYKPYSNATVGHVTQNLLVYSDNNASGFLFTENGTSKEEEILYHNIRKYDTGFSTSNFHLVDKQDFNAPIAFLVNARAWYEREPKILRSAEDLYNAPTAWEGICLPFTVKKVKGEQPGNVLSHFYGVPTTEMLENPANNNRTLHHEYWLRGLVSAESDKATFARPSADGGSDGLYRVSQESDTYQFENTYYMGLKDYIEDLGTRNDGNWYNTSHQFDKYVYLTKNVPYIVSFPGSGYYEFDLTGQTITFEANSASIDVTDDVQATPSVNGKTHKGTFLHVASGKGINSTGSAFESGQEILPFRTYMTTSSAGTRAIYIVEDGEYVDEEDEEVEPEEPADELGEDYLRIWGEGRDIVVETSQPRRFSLYNLNGVRLGTLDCKPGKNRFTQVNGGFYLVGRTKLLLK